MSRLDDARSELERYEQTKPADYQSQYKSRIDDVVGKMEAMPEFDYDPDADTAYQQYKNQYTQKAQKANRNAQASAAAQTGGYTSSYGTQAGQNAYNATMEDLDNVLDGLYSKSLAEYNTKKNGLNTELAALQAADTSAQQTWQQNWNNWYDGLIYRQNEYNAAANEEQQKKNNAINIGGNFLQLGAQILPYVLPRLLALFL